MKNDELIITSRGHFNNGHIGFSGMPQIHEGRVSVLLDVSNAAFEQFLERTNLTEASKKSIMTAMLESETPFSEIPAAVRVNYLISGDVTACINVDVSPTENSDVVGVRLSDAEKDRLKTVYNAAYSKEAPPLEYALLQARIGKEVTPLTLKDCYRFEDWTPIDTDEGEMLIRLSPSREDVENMVRRTQLWEQDYIQEMFSEDGKSTPTLDRFKRDGIEVDTYIYAYIKPDDTVEAKIQLVTFIDGESYNTNDAVALLLTDDEQRRITDAVDIELAKNNILFRLFDKSTDKLDYLLRTKVNGEYKRFITHMQTETVAVAIESAYEIVWKDDINEYCANGNRNLTLQQYIALLSSKNTLDDIYERFLKNDYANSYDDIGIVLEDTADTNMFSNAVTIKEARCRIIDAWQELGTSYLIGQAVDDPSFYYARAMNGSFSREYEYDHKPTREEVISDHTDKLAEEAIDRHEAEFGADGYRAFSDSEDREATINPLSTENSNLTCGNVCDFDFYVMNFNGGKAKLPTDTPDKVHLSLHEAIDEFKQQCAANPANYTTAIGVNFIVHEEHRDLNGGHSVGAMDFAHFKDGKLKILDDYEQDRVIQKEYALKLNTVNFIKRETADLMPKVPFYDKSLDYAKANGELDKWRESMWENRRCAKEIENLIAEFHDGSHLASGSIIDGALKQFSEERVTLVLASTVQSKDWDGRFSQSNKEWAASINIPDNGSDHEICSDAHPALLNGVINDYRKYLAVKADVSKDTVKKNKSDMER